MVQRKTYQLDNENWAVESSTHLGLNQRTGRMESEEYQNWIQNVAFNPANLLPDIDSTLSMQVRKQLDISPITCKLRVELDVQLENFLNQQCVATPTDLQRKSMRRMAAVDTLEDYVEIIFRATEESGLI